MLKVKNGYMLDKGFACVIMFVVLSLFMNGIVSIIQKHFISYSKKKDTNSERIKRK